MSTQSQPSLETESGRGVSRLFQWRVRHSAAVCVVAILVLLFSVQRAFIIGLAETDTGASTGESIPNPPVSWLRDTQVEEKNDYYLVRMSIPGIEEDELEVELDSGVLKVTGRRGVSKTKEGNNWLRRSEMRSSFQKTCSFPGEVEPEIAETKIKDGILLVKVPKSGAL